MVTTHRYHMPVGGNRHSFPQPDAYVLHPLTNGKIRPEDIHIYRCCSEIVELPTRHPRLRRAYRLVSRYIITFHRRDQLL